MIDVKTGTAPEEEQDQLDLEAYFSEVVKSFGADMTIDSDSLRKVNDFIEALWLGLPSANRAEPLPLGEFSNDDLADDLVLGVLKGMPDAFYQHESSANFEYFVIPRGQKSDVQVTRVVIETEDSCRAIYGLTAG